MKYEKHFIATLTVDVNFCSTWNLISLISPTTDSYESLCDTDLEKSACKASVSKFKNLFRIISACGSGFGFVKGQRLFEWYNNGLIVMGTRTRSFLKVNIIYECTARVLYVCLMPSLKMGMLGSSWIHVFQWQQQFLQTVKNRKEETFRKYVFDFPYRHQRVILSSSSQITFESSDKKG